MGGPPDVAELRRLLAANETPWALWSGYGPDGRGDMRVERIGHLSGSGIQTDPDSADMYGPRETFELLVSAVNALPGLLDRVREAEAGLDRVAVAMGCGDEVAGYGVYREDVDGMVECARGLREHASDHDECPRPCHCHDDRLAYPVSCEPCKGSGCGPGTASGAYEPCDHCDGTGADCSKGWVPVVALNAAEDHLAHMREARDNARAEVERLTGQVEAVRALHETWRIHSDGDHPEGCDCGEPTYIVCRSCCCDAYGDQAEECASYHDHDTDGPGCPTIRTLDGGER